MLPEDDKSLRGEPVFVKLDNGREAEGTVEFGSAVTGTVSVYTERGGRVIVRDLKRLRPDPGGARPVWKSVTSPSAQDEGGER
jgi:hypothetical protein